MLLSGGVGVHEPIPAVVRYLLIQLFKKTDEGFRAYYALIPLAAFGCRPTGQDIDGTEGVWLLLFRSFLLF